ncbi:MAG: ugpQ [Actinomycetia bacterium]|nr:ugpQ [Actinomycetes bacterium]
MGLAAVIAHRGASAAERENTVAAFARAVAMGADGIELDVHRTADGQPAIHHDAVLPDGRPISALTAAELPAHVPLLDAALDACGDLVVNIEIKEPHELADVVVAEVRNRGIAGRVLVSCFDLATVDRVRSLAPEVPTAYLTYHEVDAEQAARTVRSCVERGHSALHPWERGVDLALVSLAHAAGIAVNTWTVDDPGRIVQLAGWGVDGIVTNVPDVALRALGR